MRRVRRGTPEDIGTVIRIESNPEFRSLVGRWSVEEHLQAMRSPDVAYWLLTDEQSIAEGFCIVQGLSSTDRSAELKRIAVAVPNRGSGRELLQHVCQILFTEMDVHRIWLDVFIHNLRARSVYRSLGFREKGVLREAIYQDGAWQTLILMSLLEREFLNPSE